MPPKRTSRKTLKKTPSGGSRTSTKSAAKSGAKIGKKGPAKKPAKKPAAAVVQRPTGVLTAGMKAPGFTLPGDGGKTLALTDFAGRKLVLYFYPRADTPGCTIEAMDFSRLKPAFARAGADIIGVSADPVRALDAFKSKRELTIALASDETRGMLDA
jgi:thioredoxin-dependent peroxiredoxin